jgi:hypothetical protein
MGDNKLVELCADFFVDALEALGVPAGAAGGLFSLFMQKRLDQARDILLEELSSGQIDLLQAAQQDEAIAIIYRCMLAVRDGAARRNLRLLARVVSGLGQRDRLFADEFNKYAEALARLSRDEILVIGTLHMLKKFEQGQTEKAPPIATYWPAVIRCLVPSAFLTEEHVIAVCCSSQRSGLVINGLDFDSSAYYGTSPFMDEVAELVDFRDVLRREGDLPPDGA